MEGTVWDHFQKKKEPEDGNENRAIMSEKLPWIDQMALNVQHRTRAWMDGCERELTIVLSRSDTINRRGDTPFAMAAPRLMNKGGSHLREEIERGIWLEVRPKIHRQIHCRAETGAVSVPSQLSSVRREVIALTSRVD